MKKIDKETPLSRKPSSTARKIAALAGGTVSAVSLTGTSQAAIVHVVNNLSIDTADPDTIVNWDVDGNAEVDFRLSKSVSSSTVYLRLGSNGLNGEGFINQGPPFGKALRNLPNGFLVQSTPTAGYGWGNGHVNRTILTQPTGGTFSAVFNTNGFTSGVSGNVGFRFAGDSGTHYGWASITITRNNSSIVIHEWAYNDQVDSPIAVGAVPEPSVAALGLLAAGAAGLRRRRSKKQ